jgi:hypothetical protein
MLGTTPTRRDIYLSAIKADGTVNVGYLVMFKALRVMIGGVVVASLIAIYAVWTSAAAASEILRSYGYGTGAIAGGFATTLGAIGLFMWGDSHTPPVQPGTVTEIKTTTVDHDDPKDKTTAIVTS